MDNQKAELEFAAENKEKLQKKVKELSEVAAEKANELEAIRAEHKAYKLNTETLVSCFKVSHYYNNFIVGEKRY